MDDRVAIEKTLAGQGEVFGLLVSRYAAKVYAVALARVYDPQDAQDLSQEAFLRAYERLPMLRNRDAFAPWLFSILRHLCLDFMRGKWRTELREHAMKPPDGQLEASTDPRQRIAAQDSAKTLWSLVGQLDDKSREVLGLHYGQQMNVREIAALIGVRESAVKMRLKKARSVLGDRANSMRSVWAAAPLPALSSSVMGAVKAAGPLKAGMTAAGGILGACIAWMAMAGWVPGQDAERWRGHAPAGMLSRGKRIFLLSAVIVLAVFFLALRLPAILHGPAVLVPCFVVNGALLAAIFKREIELISRQDQVKQCVNAGCALFGFVAMPLLPHFMLTYVGIFLMLQFFFVNKANVAGGTVLPGVWVAPLLKHHPASEAEPVPVSEERMKAWLTMLHEYGLVAPPCKRDADSVTVRLRLRTYIGEKVAWGAHSALQVHTHGIVSCTVIPRDYVALAQYFGPGELPGRRELATRFGESFTKALSIYANGGDRVAVADSLGLAECPLDVKRTHTFRLQRYILPITGAVLTIISVFSHLK